jgi:hypothetical protein
MVRTVHRPATLARFERLEHDGRDHSPWVLEAGVQPTSDVASRLTMHLHYGGGMFGPVVENLLQEEIRRSRTRLLSVIGT